MTEHHEEDRRERLLAAFQAVQAVNGSPDIIESIKRALEADMKGGK